jgi:hypothetical protein
VATISVLRPKAQSIGQALTWPRDLLACGFIGGVSVLLVAFFLIQAQRLVGTVSMPLDDAWIHYRIAENLATGQGFSFNPGVPTSASTSPLWTVLLAATYWAAGDFIVPSIAQGVAFSIAANVAVYYLALALKPDRRLAVVAALLTTVAGRWIWSSLSGMETTLFTALALWGVLLLVANDRSGRPAPAVAGGALLALSTLARPEGFLLIGLAIGEAFVGVVLDSRGQSVGARVGRLLRSRFTILLLALVVAIGLRVLYTATTSGGVLGNTFAAQSLPQGNSGYTGPRWLPDLWYWRSAVQSLRTDAFVLGLLIPLGMVHVARLGLVSRAARTPAVLGLAWFVALPLFNAFVAPNLRHHERYLMPLIPLTMLFGAFGIDFLVRQLNIASWRLRSPRRDGTAITATLFAVVTLACLGDALLDARRWATQYAGDVRNIEQINVAMGAMVRDMTPPDAYVAMNDIGAIAVVSNRRILDTVGIAEPGILPILARQGRQGVFQYLQEKRPQYLVVWPEWYPELVARTDVFTPIGSVKVDDPITAIRAPMLGGREMVLYRATWP